MRPTGCDWSASVVRLAASVVRLAASVVRLAASMMQLAGLDAATGDSMLRLAGCYTAFCRLRLDVHRASTGLDDSTSRPR
jgi:hypothetical protein